MYYIPQKFPLHNYHIMYQIRKSGVLQKNLYLKIWLNAETSNHLSFGVHKPLYLNQMNQHHYDNLEKCFQLENLLDYNCSSNNIHYCYTVRWDNQFEFRQW